MPGAFLPGCWELPSRPLGWGGACRQAELPAGGSLGASASGASAVRRGSLQAQGLCTDAATLPLGADPRGAVRRHRLSPPRSGSAPGPPKGPGVERGGDETAGWVWAVSLATRGARGAACPCMQVAWPAGGEERVPRRDRQAGPVFPSPTSPLQAGGERLQPRWQDARSRTEGTRSHRSAGGSLSEILGAKLRRTLGTSLLGIIICCSGKLTED